MITRVSSKSHECNYATRDTNLLSEKIILSKIFLKLKIDKFILKLIFLSNLFFKLTTFIVKKIAAIQLSDVSSLLALM